VPSGGGRPRPVVEQPGHAVSLVWTKDGSGIIYAFDSPIAPADLWRVDVATGRREQLTYSAHGAVDPADLGMPEHVTWASPRRFVVHGPLYTPKEIVAGQHGCLVSIHGGPMNQSRSVWDPITQHFVQRGWVVVKSNYRGTLGHGRAYREALFGE